jgi:hypothetical protein
MTADIHKEFYMATEDATTLTVNETVPSSWPGAWGVFKYSRNVVRNNLWVVVGLNFVSWTLSGAVSSFNSKPDHATSVWDVAANLLSLWFSVALTFVILAGLRNQKLGFVDALKKSVPYYLKALLLSILTVVILFLSLLLLVIPFFFVAPRISLAMYYLLDKDMGVVDSLKASWQATHGNVGKVWGIIGVTIVFALLIIVLVGIYFLIMYLAASAVLYAYLQAAKSDSPVVAEAPASVDTPQAPIA